MKTIRFAIFCCFSFFLWNSNTLSAQTLTATMSSTSATCNNSSNGTASVTVTGGVPPYTYIWSPTPLSGQGTSSISGLSAGSWIVTVSDSASNTTSETVIITQPPALSITMSSINATCNNLCDGSATAIVSGGVGLCTYSWTPMGGNTSTAIGLCPGTYSVEAMDSRGCSVMGVDTIREPAALAMITSSTASSCSSPSGSASVSVSGGNTPYTYSWSPGLIPAGQGTASVAGLGAGSYTVSVTQPSGCIQWAAVTVFNNNPTANVVSQTNPSCNSTCNGSVTISGNGGTAPYTYFWNSGSNAPSISNLCAGTDSVTVTDANGCKGSITVTIASAPIQAILTTTNVTCLSNGSISANIMGGVPPYSYSWSPEIITGQGTSVVSGLTPGSYTISVIDANGCSYVAFASIYNSNPLFISTHTFNLKCKGVNNGSAFATVYNGTSPYIYSWSNGVTTDTVLNLSSGTYQVQVVDANGCIVKDSVTILSPGNLFLALSSTNANCSSNGTVSVSSIQGGTSPYIYSWNTSPPQTTATATSLSGGTYSVSVTDSNGCTASGMVSVGSTCLNIIKGRVFQDLNNNCIQDAGENGIPGVWLWLSYSGYGYTNVNGDYDISTNSLNDTLHLIAPNGYGSACQPLTIPIHLNAPGDTSSNNNFALSVPSGFDLAIHPGWTAESRPGFQKEYWIFYWNQGFTVQNGIVTLQYDSTLIFTSCTNSGVVNITTHTITWSLSNIQSGQWLTYSQQLLAYFTIPNTATLGSMLHSHFEIDPISGDINPSNNTLDDYSPITGSHDPNSKQVMPQGLGASGAITPKDSVLLYTINFQNSGTDTAFTVIVKDTLSSFLDPASIIPGASNHPYTFSMDGKGILTWRFDHILLPDSTQNVTASSGSFNYTVKLKKGIPYGSVIKNTAYVYFDFNTPVVTNTTVNTLTSPLFVNQIKNDVGQIRVYPNPFDQSTTLLINGANQTREYVLYDLVGRDMRRFVSSENTITINRESLSAGMYLLKVYSGNVLMGEERLILK
jgi:hypothetical protein